MKISKLTIDEYQAEKLKKFGINEMIGVGSIGTIYFTIDGLIDLLPEIEVVGPNKGELYQLNIHKTNEGWYAFYEGMDILPPQEELIDAIYNLVIWCIKNKLKS